MQPTTHYALTRRTKHSITKCNEAESSSGNMVKKSIAFLIVAMKYSLLVRISCGHSQCNTFQSGHF